MAILAMVSGVVAAAFGDDLVAKKPGGRIIQIEPVTSRECLWNNVAGGSIFNEAHASQRDEQYPFRAGSADDFVCGSCEVYQAYGVVSKVQWWGIYFNPGPPGNETAFEINFYADDANQPTGGGLANPRTTAAAAFEVPIEDILVQNLGNDLFQYEYTFPADNRPVLECHGRYWIEFVAVGVFPPQWGMVNSAYDQRLGLPVEGFPALSMPYWTQLSLNLDLAFRVWSSCVSCESDLDNSGFVDLTDLGMLLGEYGCTGGGCNADLDESGVVDLTDLGILLADYGAPCP